MTIDVSTHAIQRFRERSRVPGVQHFPAWKVEKMVSQLVQLGEVVKKGLREKGLEIIEITYEVNKEQYSLYFFTSRELKTRKVVTVYTETQFEDWLQRHR